MFSTPPAINTSPSPALIAWAALAAACSPEPHNRFTVWPGTSTGRPAKRSGGVIEVVRIHPHRACLDRAGHAVRFLHVLGPDARREAVARAVGELDALRLVLEREHRQYRSEDFFVHDLHAGCGAVEHGRLAVEALAVDLGRFAAGHEPGACLRSRGEAGTHRRLLPLAHGRPQQQGGEGRLVGRLEHHGASRRERRGHLPRGQVQGEVPRHDRTHHAHRLAQRVREEVAVDGHRIAGELVGPAGVVAERLDRHGDVDLRLEQRLAVVPGLDLGDLLGALLQQVGHAIQQQPAPAGRQLAPLFRLEAGAGRPHRGVHLRLARLGDFRERLLGGGVGETVARRRRPPLIPDQQVGLHRPLHSATRFSTLAAMPSFASSLWNSCCCSSRSSASADSKGISAPVCTDRLIRPTAFDALWGGQNWFAYSMTCSQNSLAGRISWTMPSSFARSNENSSPFAMSSIARALPTRRASRCVPPVPGSTPRFTSGSPILPAFSFASRKSHAIAISSPPPTVCPLSAAMVSLGVCSRRLRVSLACRQKKNLKRGVTVLSIPMFAPAEKNLSPWPRSTITWTLSSKRALRIASSSWCIMS